MIAATKELPVRRVSRRNGASPPSPPSPPRNVANTREADNFLPVLTLVIWSGCLLVGLAGTVFAYARPMPPVQEPPPVTAEVLNVDLAASDLAPEPSPTPDLQEPPPLAPPTIPSAPPPMAVAAPSPEIAFAVPIKAPARIVPAADASFCNLDAPISEPTPAPLAVRPLTFGQGEGKQPAPEYPRAALREGQEGVVTVGFSVDMDGRVLTAEAATPSPWPLLNDAAIRVVKSRWRFAPGVMRRFEVAIRFQINK